MPEWKNRFIPIKAKPKSNEHTHVCVRAEQTIRRGGLCDFGSAWLLASVSFGAKAKKEAYSEATTTTTTQTTATSITTRRHTDTQIHRYTPNKHER